MTVFWVVIIWPFKILRTVVIYQNRVLEEIFQESPRLWTLKNSPGTGQFLLPAQHSHFRPFDLLPIKESAMTHNQNYSPEATLHDYGNLRFTLGPLLELCKNYTHNYNSSHWHVSGRAEIWSILYIYIYIYIYSNCSGGPHFNIVSNFLFFKNFLGMFELAQVQMASRWRRGSYYFSIVRMVMQTCPAN
jgi:hypothetical protein